MPAARPTHDLSQLLASTERLIRRRLAAALRSAGPHGIGVAEWRVLALLSDGAGHPMSEVAEFALLPPPTLTKLVDRLVADNLVYRRVDAADRRRVLVHLTARGRALHRRLNRVVRQHHAELAGITGDAEAARLAELLDRLRGGFG